MTRAPHAWVWAAIVVLLVTARTALPQTAPPEALTILSPAADAYLSGRTTIRARLEPAAGATLTFFVDGRQICTVSRPPLDCEWDAGSSIVAHQIRVVAALPDGRRLVSNVRSKGIAYAERADVDVIQVTATVSDGQGHYVRQLPRSAFHLWEDGRPQTITHFQSEDVPLDLVVALDISSSMTTAMPKLREAAKEFLSKVSPRDTVTVVGFNDNIFTLTRRSVDQNERVRAIDRLAAWGATALYDVIISSVETAGRETGRKALIVFTDGEDQGSRARIEDVEQALQESDITLYMIGQGRGTSVDEMKRIMRRLAEPTGGRALFTDDIDDLREAFAELLDELSNQYLLGYIPTNARRDGELRTIKVEVDGYTSLRHRKSYRLPRADQ